MNKQMKTLDGVYFNDVTARQQIAGKADRVHTHSFNQLTNKPQIPEQYDDTQLRQQIAGKANSAHTHSYNDLTDKPQTSESYDDTQIRQQIAGKANAVHTHSYNDLTDKPTIPEGYDDALVKSDIVSLNEAIATVTKDVQINGTSVKDADGVANIPIASQNGLGVSQYLTSNGIVANNGKPYINAASNQNIDKRTTDRVCIMPRNINYAVTAALTDSNHLTMTSAQQDTACNTIGAERKLADGWVLKGTITDTNGISVDLAGCAELAIFGVAVVTDNTSIMSNVGRLSYNCLKTNAKAVLLMYEDSVWGFCCTHAKSANSTTPVTMADNSAGDSKVDGSKVADINSIYFTDPTNVTSCNIKIYAR